MRVTPSYNPMLPINGDNPFSAIAPISPAQSVYYNTPGANWWGMVSAQLGDRVADMLKESLYGQRPSQSFIFPNEQVEKENILRLTLETEIWNAQKQQRIANQEAEAQENRIRMLQIQAKSDMWLEEKARMQAEQEAQMLALERSQSSPPESTTTSPSNKEQEAQETSPTTQKGKDGEPLSEEEMRVVQELKVIDANVKRHEAAHISAGGGLVRGGANYSYTEGPDGLLYATAGEVSIDTSETGEPKKDIQKAQQIRAAALAPSDPSPQDYRVAAHATMMEMKAQMRLAEEFSEGLRRDQGARIYQDNMDDLQKSQSSPPHFRIIA